MTADLEDRLRTSMHSAKLPPAPDYLRRRTASLVTPTAALKPKAVHLGGSSRSRPWLLLPAAAILVALVGMALLIPGAPPPTVVDGLPVLSVSDVLAQRAGGGLRNQPVAVGGYWSDGSVAHMCAPPLGQPGVLELYCADGEFGITERNEPITLVGRFHQFVYIAQGPHLTPFFEQGEPGTGSYWHPDGTGWGSPPVPIVVVGHFDDPRADLCQASARQICLDRLVVDRIAYFNPGLARWPPGIPTPEPTDPPAPPTYAPPAY